MATLTLRLPDELLAELNGLAQAREVSVSEAVRQVLQAHLRSEIDPDSDRTTSSPDVPASLSVVQRHQMALLHRILARLLPEDHDGEEGEPADQIGLAKLLENGYSARYSEVFAGIDPELRPAEGELVYDLLDMFRILGASYGRLPEGERDRLGSMVADSIRFRGFDANDRVESRLLYFAQDLIADGKWEEQATLFNGSEHGNSHLPLLGSYLRMLAVFTPIWKQKVRTGDGLDLTSDEIRRIAEGTTQPRVR